MVSQALQIALLMPDSKVDMSKGGSGSGANGGKVKGEFWKFLEKAGLAKAQQGVGKKNGNTGSGDWMAYFRDCLRSGNISIKDMSVLSEMKTLLKKMLMSDGISEKDVNAFIQKLFENGGKTEIQLSELLEKVDAFRLQNRNEEDVFFEMSDAAHLESVLREFQLDAEEVKKIIGSAQDDEGRISVKKLIEELRKISSERKEIAIKDGQEVSVEKVAYLLEKIGVESEAVTKKGTMALKDFVSMVQHGVEKNSSDTQLSIDTVESEVKKLVANLKQVAAKTEVHGETASERLFGSEGIAFHENSKMVKRPGQKRNKNVALEKGDDKKSLALGDLKKAGVAKSEDVVAKVEKLVESIEKGAMHRHAEPKDGNIHSGDAVKAMDSDRMIPLEGNQKEMARPVPAYVINQVGKKVGLALQRGENRVHFQLKPPHLGTIELNMSMKNNVLKLGIVSEHHAVKELMVSHVHELREALVEQGIELHKVDVQIEYNFGQSMSNAHKQAGRFKPWQQHWKNGEDDDTVEVAAVHQPMVTDGALDMFA